MDEFRAQTRGLDRKIEQFAAKISMVKADADR